jgi:hypothetical protein
MKDCSEARITVAPNVECQLVDNQAVLLNPRTELQLGLSPEGVRMWSALANAPSIPSACETLLEGSAVKPADVRNDLYDFMGQLWLYDLIRIDADASSENELMMSAVAVAAR